MHRFFLSSTREHGPKSRTDKHIFMAIMTPPGPSPEYPSRCSRTHTVEELKPAVRAVIAGRILFDRGDPVLRDETGRIPLSTCVSLSEGDILEATGVLEPTGFKVASIRTLTPCRTTPSVGLDISAVRTRSRLLEATRRFFYDRGFLEVETPSVVRSPGMEPHIDPFLVGGVDDEDLYLHTSPEYAMKRLLCGGAERIFQICKAHRRDDPGPMHNPEFTILEWYRAYSDYREIMLDAEALIHGLFIDTLGSSRLEAGDRSVELDPPWERVTVREVLEKYVGITADVDGDPEEFVRQARSREYSTVGVDDSADIAFQKVFLDLVEPHLGLERPTLLVDYPSSMAALAKRKSEDPFVAERFEVYIAGTELANGFTELNDPAEQRERFESETAYRARIGARHIPIDDRFLSALEEGIPPSGGVALGMDRLLMLLMDVERIQDVLPFPYPDL